MENRPVGIDWKPVSRMSLGAWTAFYAGFFIYAARDTTGFLLIDHANLIVHEAGHLLFGWFGHTLGLWGGTLLELLVPALLAAYFVVQRDMAGSVFCSFLFFENFLYISVYMADARVQQLPLVTVGDPAPGGHDWFAIFSSLGVLAHDKTIARMVRLLGWLGMLGAVAYFWLKATVSQTDNQTRGTSGAPGPMQN
jgi:hypothetical protein